MQGFDELLRDCRVLFGREAVVNRQFLESLQMPELKTAFRRKALTTHPDLFSGQAQVIQKYHAELFMGASEAYRRLSEYLNGRRPRVDFAAAHRHAPPRPKPEPRARPGRDPYYRRDGGYARRAGSKVYTPHIAPAWPLRTGEFLYYSKVISWGLLISAIVWQRQQRERIGEIAQRWGWLSEAEILGILSSKPPSEPLGEVLLRRAWITQFQLATLLWHQKKSQLPIGRFFVEKGLITEASLRAYLADLEEHNRKFRPHDSAYPNWK